MILRGIVDPSEVIEQAATECLVRLMDDRSARLRILEKETTKGP